MEQLSENDGLVFKSIFFPHLFKALEPHVSHYSNCDVGERTLVCLWPQWYIHRLLTKRCIYKPSVKGYNSNGSQTPNKTDQSEVLWCFDKPDTDSTSVQGKQESIFNKLKWSLFLVTIFMVRKVSGQILVSSPPKRKPITYVLLPSIHHSKQYVESMALIVILFLGHRCLSWGKTDFQFVNWTNIHK